MNILLPKMKITKEELEKLYNTKKVKEIAKILGCSTHTIFKYLHRYGIKLKNKTKKIVWTDEEIEKLKQIYPTFKKEEIIRLLNKSWSAIRTKASELGIKRITIKGIENLNLENLKESEKGWITGIIEGEGAIYLSKVNWKGYIYLSPKLTIHNTRKELIDKIQKLIGGKVYIDKNGRRKKPLYIFTISNVINILRILQTLKPYFVSKKEECNLMIEFCKLRLENFHLPNSKREWEIYERLKLLNK
jgi:hypothetical protein